MDLRQLIGNALSPVGGRPHRTPPYFGTKKVAILGCTSNIEFAPWYDPTWTLVAHCSARQFCKREPDWYFDMHRPECFKVVRKSWNPQYFEWLRTLQTPIFMQEDAKDPWTKIPMAVRYPIERVTAEYRPYFTNHTAYMIALAMTEGVTHIGLFGCQYANDSEYAVQRDSLTYWMGRFEQAGGTLVIPPKWNTLLSYPRGLYGYASHDEQGKLTDEYRLKPAAIRDKSRLAKVAAQPTGHVADAEGFTVDPQTGACAVPLMVPPPYAPEPPALDRLKEFTGELVHA